MNKALFFALLALGACGGARVETAAQPPIDWRRVATPADRERLRQWRVAFVSALDEARLQGHAAEIAREGALLEPDAGTPARPPAGDYGCRVIKLGSRGETGLAYVTYPVFQCRIDEAGGRVRFRKLTGSQRPAGTIIGDNQRQVFLGTLMLSDESRPLDYGRDPDRDMIGAVQALGDQKWRLILPYPRYESLMDVIELVPAKLEVRP